MKKHTSEFGKGFIYNLILFAKHWWIYFKDIEDYKEAGLSKNRAITIWFNGASDHFYELEIPPKFKKKKIGKLTAWLQKKCLYWGHRFKGEPTEKDFEEVFEKLEELARLIDKELGIKDIEATYK